MMLSKTKTRSLQKVTDVSRIAGYKKWMAIALFALQASCFDDESVQLANGGISGTGISVGPITGFGSIYVDGKKYNTDNTEFYRDGKLSSIGQADFRMGEVINIQTGINDVTGEDTAIRVDFGSAVIGVTGDVSADGKTVKVLGYDVEVDDMSVPYGFQGLSGLEKGALIQVSGSMGGQNKLLASAVVLQQESFVAGESSLLFKGVISQLNQDEQTFVVRDVNVDYSQASLMGFDEGLADGLTIEVISQQAVNDEAIVADSVSLVTKSPYALGEPLSTRGLVSKVNADKSFVLNGITMTTIESTELVDSDLDTLSVNDLVRVEGSIGVNNSLVVKKMAVLKKAGEDYATFSGRLTDINIVDQMLSVSGQQFKGLDTKILTLVEWIEGRPQPLLFNNLALGDRIKLTGRFVDGSFYVLRLDKEEIGETTDLSSVSLKGIPSASDVSNKSISLLGAQVQLDEQTEILGFNQQSIDTLVDYLSAQGAATNTIVSYQLIDDMSSLEKLFALLQAQTTIVAIEGREDSATGSVKANKITLY